MLAIYLKSLAFIGFIIVARFLLDRHLFSWEAIGINNFGLLPFQTYLKMAQKLFPFNVVNCIIPFMQFTKKGDQINFRKSFQTNYTRVNANYNGSLLVSHWQFL
jgi:hypothetical protein